jgi:2,5-furandicarboxylate decarboxylase 1
MTKNQRFAQLHAGAGGNGQLVTIHKTVSRELEIGSVLATLESANLGAGYMKSVEGSEFAVVGNMLGSMDRIALALGCEKNVITDFLGKCLENPIPPVEVTNAPCQQNVMRGEDVDLFKLPYRATRPRTAARSSPAA